MQKMPPLKTKNPPWLRLLIWGLISLPVLFLLVVVLIAGWRWQLKRDVDRQLTQLRTQGIPLNGEELDDFYPKVPANQNAALVMTQAFALMQEYSGERRGAVSAWKAPRRGDRISPEDVELLKGHVAMNSDALVMARDARKLPLSRYPVDFSAGFDTPLPHLSKLRNLARCEYYSALLNIEEGNLAEASDNILAMLAFSRTLESEPTLISQFVDMAIVFMAANGTESLVNAGPLGMPELRDMAAAFEGAARTNRLVLGLSGELAMFAPLFRMSWAEIQYHADGGGTRPPPSGGRSPFICRLTGFFERDLLFYLSTMQTNLMFAALPPPESLGVVPLEAEINETAKRKFYILASLFLPALSKASVKDARATAHIRLTMTALAVEQFRNTESHLPELLVELVPTFLASVPIDPFDGQPLRYRKLDRGYVIYSVGEDGQDDDGREPPPRITSTDTNSYDLTFIVER